MAPVGCWESLTAAIEAGANSIYFGVEEATALSRLKYSLYNCLDFVRMVRRE